MELVEIFTVEKNFFMPSFANVEIYGTRLTLLGSDPVLEICNMAEFGRIFDDCQKLSIMQKSFFSSFDVSVAAVHVFTVFSLPGRYPSVL
jgi:hypothetical protein